MMRSEAEVRRMRELLIRDLEKLEVELAALITTRPSPRAESYSYAMHEMEEGGKRADHRWIVSKVMLIDWILGESSDV